MRFEFVGNMDVPEWILAEITLINRMGSGKLKQVLGMIVKKVQGLNYEQEKLHKLCKDQDFDTEETRCVVAILDFIISNAAKHDVSDQILSKDLLQMGVEVEHADVIIKVYGDN